MIQVFSGEDYVNRKKEYDLFLKSQREEGDSFVFCDEEDIAFDSINRFISGGGMFIDRVFVVLQDTLRFQKVFDLLERSVEEMKESQTVFVFIEDTKLSKENKKFLENNDIDIKEFSVKEQRDFGNFAVTDALLSRDKKSIWVELNKSLSKDGSPEALHGLLWWQIKSLYLVSLGLSQEKLEMKDFPYKKTKKAVSLFKKEELSGLVRDFPLLPKKSRDDGVSLYEEMEKFFLEKM